MAIWSTERKKIISYRKTKWHSKHRNLCLSNTHCINQTWQEAERGERDEKVTVTFRKSESQKLCLSRCAVNILAKHSGHKAAVSPVSSLYSGFEIKHESSNIIYNRDPDRKKTTYICPRRTYVRLSHMWEVHHKGKLKQMVYHRNNW